MRILVVEDDAALSGALKRRLPTVGFSVEVAEDGEQGLFAGLHYPLDAAVVDLGLPKKPGMDVIREWRANELKFPMECESNVVQQLISRLRRKLDPEDRIHPIETVYGRGYRFTVPRRC